MSLNPFNWTAGPFLAFYTVTALILFGFAFRSRRMIGPAASRIQPLRELELAYLAGGESRLGDAVLLSLASNNAATISPGDHRITVTSQAPLAALIERPPHLPVQPGMTRQQFQTALAPLVGRMKTRLQTFGYCPTDAQLAAFRGSVLPFIGLLLLVGITKVVVGTERHHSVGILIFLLVMTVIAAISLAKPPMRTRAGRAALESYEASHARAARAPRDHELLLAVALSGAMVLSGTAYAAVLASSLKLSSSSDGGSGCGGGGGGGGGCGGCS